MDRDLSDLMNRKGMTPDELIAYAKELKNRPIVYGYCRVSSYGQSKYGTSLVAQEEELKANGAECIYRDVYSGRHMERPGLNGLLKTVKEGDTIIITKLDRFARTLTEGSVVIDDLLSRGVTVKILNLGTLDNSTSGKLIWHVFLCFAEFERSLIRERLETGKEMARKNPDFREGRPSKFTEFQRNQAVEMYLSGLTARQVKELTGISRSTLYRLVGEYSDK